MKILVTILCSNADLMHFVYMCVSLFHIQVTPWIGWVPVVIVINDIDGSILEEVKNPD